MGTVARRGREKELFRSKVLEAAKELIAESGYEELTIRKIAEKIEYSPMSIYGHFENKHDILLALAREGFLRLVKALPKPGSAEPLDLLRKAMLQYIAFGLKNQQEYEVLFLMRRARDGLQSRDASSEANIPNEAGGQTAFRVLLQYVDAGLEAGLLRGQRFEIAKVLWAGAHGCVSLQLTQPGFPFGPSRVFAQAVVDTLLAGVRA
ncbi:MAG TPA: TetR/AcrR family transcriptional regulator [Acidobacteriaceae bacterium]|nr:TetR/AcrR family transcriptional regulator [Acidobacteriaceae bacterium]